MSSVASPSKGFYCFVHGVFFFFQFPDNLFEVEGVVVYSRVKTANLDVATCDFLLRASDTPTTLENFTVNRLSPLFGTDIGIVSFEDGVMLYESIVRHIGPVE